MPLEEHVDLLPILLALVVWGIEWYGHKRHLPWSFELGLPLGSREEILGAPIPTPVPEDWLGEFEVESIVGSRLTFTPEVNGEHAATCFGVITFSPRGSQTLAHYATRASFGPLAFCVAVVAAVRMHGVDLQFAAGGGLVLLGIWMFRVWSHKRCLDDTYEMLSASILRRAVEG